MQRIEGDSAGITAFQIPRYGTRDSLRNKMKATLQGYCYWPRMHEDIENYAHHCTACTLYQQREDRSPMTPTAEKETEPWKSIAVDLTRPADVLDGRVLLTVIDLYSRYPKCFILREGTTAEIIIHLRSVFASHGFPGRSSVTMARPLSVKNLPSF